MKTYAPALYTAALLTACSPQPIQTIRPDKMPRPIPNPTEKTLPCSTPHTMWHGIFTKNTTPYLSKHTNPNTPAHPSASNSPTAAPANRHYP